MARSGLYALTLAMILAIFDTGSCLRCYQCNTQQNQDCGDPFKASKYLVDCNTPDSVTYNQQNLFNVLPPEVFGTVTGAPRYCHKIVMGSGTIIRTCLDTNPTDISHTCRLMDLGSKVAMKEKKIAHCSVCDKEGCNGAASMAVSVPLATLALIASYLYCKQ